MCECALAGRGAPLETLDEEALGRSRHWAESRFGELERFMVDFLVGGAAAGESLRLKLQTPLFVADALLEAARQQLSSEVSTAESVRPDANTLSVPPAGTAQIALSFSTTLARHPAKADNH